MKLFFVITMALGIICQVPLCPNPNTVRTMGKIVNIARMTSPTKEIEAMTNEWLLKARSDVEHAQFYGCEFIDKVLAELVAIRLDLLNEHSLSLAHPDSADVRESIDRLTVGIGYLIRLLVIMGERAPSPILRTQVLFERSIYYAYTDEEQFKHEYARCKTPVLSSTILRPKPVHPYTPTPHNSPS